MQRIESAIDGLNSPLDREVMRRRYIEGLAWAQVGRLLHYSESHVRRIHDKALKRMNREPA